MSEMSSLQKQTPRSSVAVELLEVIGPILAGFQITAALIGYVSVGSLASWVIKVWFPVTRAMWENIKLYFALPIHLTDLEKDALTTIAFFTPITISALMRRRGAVTPRSIQIAALFTAIAFAWIVGRQLLSDVLHVFKYFGGDFFAVMIVVFLIPALIAGSLLATVVALEYFKVDSELADPGRTTIGAWFARIREWLIQKLDYNVGSKISLAVLAVILLCTVGVQIYIMYSYFSDVGVIRGVAVITFMAMLVITVFFSPKRLFYTLGAFLAFALSAGLWELILIIVGVFDKMAGV